MSIDREPPRECIFNKYAPEKIRRAKYCFVVSQSAARHARLTRFGTAKIAFTQYYNEGLSFFLVFTV
jgi:hypothetical protein